MKRHIVYVSYEEGTEGELLPTLWDAPHPGAKRAVWEDDGERITLKTEEE